LKFLTFAQDARTHKYLNQIGVNNVRFVGQIDPQKDTEEGAHAFGRGDFNLISVRKMEAVYTVLKLGYDVVFLDTDVVLVNDPIPIFVWNNVDYVFGINAYCDQRLEWDFYKSQNEGNTGFYFVRSNAKVFKLWDEFLKLAVGYGIDDQTFFWSTIRNIKDPKVSYHRNCSHQSSVSDMLVTCTAEQCQTGAGGVMEFDTFKKNVAYMKGRGFKPVAVHANFITGNEFKMKHLNGNGLWLATQAADATWNGVCKPLLVEF